jgi:hypothetical protein
MTKTASPARVLKLITPLLGAVLFAVFPLLSLFTQNQSGVELSVLWWPLALSVGSAVALFGLFLLITKRAAKAGALASLVVVAFFYYGPVADQASSWGLSDGWFFALWLALLIGGGVAIVRTSRDLFNLTVIAGVAAAVMTLPRVADIAIYHANHPSTGASDARLWPTALEKPVLPSGTRPPDIYVLIPDDYARADVLRRYFHYDDSGFIRQLEKRGFVISQQSRSPYSFSELNMAATLNMDYLTNFPQVLGKNSQDFRPAKRVIQDSRASRMLKALGYHYVHLDTDEVTFAGRNPDISPLASPDSFANLWMQKSILRRVGGTLGFNRPATNERFRKSVRSVFSELGALRQEAKPKFVVFHTLLPHDPFIFGARAEPVTFPAGADHTGRPGMAYYLRQLQFVNRKLLEAVDQIFAHAKTPPVVVIQADEGFEVNPDVFGEAASRDIRVKGLSAFYLPGRRRPAVPQPPNTVNTMRFVFNQYLGTHYTMLRSASYLEGDRPYVYEEIAVK